MHETNENLGPILGWDDWAVLRPNWIYQANINSADLMNLYDPNTYRVRML